MLCFAHAFLSYSCVFPVPAFMESSNSKEPLQIYFIFRYASKKTLCVMSCSCRAVIHPTWGAPSTEAFTAAEIPPQTFFHRLRSSSPLPAATPTALPSSTWADEPEDYTVLEERSHSFVFAYVMHRLILHATLSSCSPIRLWVSSKLMVKLEFLKGIGVHIVATINSICLLSG